MYEEYDSTRCKLCVGERGGGVKNARRSGGGVTGESEVWVAEKWVPFELLSHLLGLLSSGLLGGLRGLLAGGLGHLAVCLSARGAEERGGGEEGRG